MKHITSTPKDVRKFGIMFSVICLMVAALSVYKGSTIWTWMLGGSAFFLITGLFVHQILKPIYIGWMTFAFALGWVNTRIILGLVYYLIFTPVSLILRLLRKDILEMRIDKKVQSYWVMREPVEMDPKRYENLF